MLTLTQYCLFAAAYTLHSFDSEIRFPVFHLSTCYFHGWMHHRPSLSLAQCTATMHTDLVHQASGL